MTYDVNHSERANLSTIRNADGSTEGRDPRTLSVEELGFLGHMARPLLDAIKAKCLDCSCYQRSEVDKVHGLRLRAVAIPEGDESVQGSDVRGEARRGWRKAPECPEN